MDNKLPDFFLGTPDSNIFSEPRACWLKGRIAGSYRDDGAWVLINPPMIGQRFGLGDKDITHLILFTRHRDATLSPISEWPLYVYVLRALDDAIFQHGRFNKEEVEEIAWGALYRTFEEAKAASQND